MPRYRNKGGPHFRRGDSPETTQWFKNGDVLEVTPEELKAFPDKWEPVAETEETEPSGEEAGSDEGSEKKRRKSKKQRRLERELQEA